MGIVHSGRRKGFLNSFNHVPDQSAFHFRFRDIIYTVLFTGQHYGRGTIHHGALRRV
jgi:hypothetical protein